MCYPPLLLLLALWTVAGCLPPLPTDSAQGGDADADSDTDADADSDADTDTDSDADTDADSDADTDVDTGPFDNDGDGYTVADGDCDDTDSAVNPGEAEVCADGVDNDCDGGPGPCAPASTSLGGAVEYTGSANERVGNSVAVVGDVDGDGYDDLLIGAGNPGNGASEGAAYLVLGSLSPGSSDLSSAVKFTGELPDDFAGDSLAGAGDVNGDGLDDMLVGAPDNDDGPGDNPGAAYLILGTATPRSANLSAAVEFSGETPNGIAGAVAGAGDVDGDGYDDMLIGAYNDDGVGAAYLVSGSSSPTSTSLSTAVKYVGEAAGDDAARGIAGAGDVDGDGYDDLVIGAYGNNAGGIDAGGVYLVLGGTTLSSSTLATAVKFQGAAAYDYAGFAVAGASDVDGDGYDDFLVGAQGDGGGAGAAYLVLGSATPTAGNLSSSISYTGEGANDAAGISVAGAGDIDHDGYGDVLVGAYANDDGGNTAGAAYLVLGSAAPSGTSLGAAVQYTGEAAADMAGCSVAGGGDVDGDGYDDLLVGAWFAGSYSGSAYLIMGTGL